MFTIILQTLNLSILCHIIRFFFATLATFSFIYEANRLKILEGSRWEKPFILGGGTLIVLNGLAFYKNYFNKPLPDSLGIITDASWRYAPAIKLITRIVFAIFEFHGRPKELFACVLGACVYRITLTKNPSSKIIWIANNIDLCASGVKFYVGSRVEKTLIAAYHIAALLYHNYQQTTSK